METTNPITATEILDDIIQPIEPSFSPEFARIVLSLGMSAQAQGRIRDLLQRNNAGTLNAGEKQVLENYLLVGQFLDLMQARARVSLQGRDASP